MTATSTAPSGTSRAGGISMELVDRGPQRTGPFVLTLCRFDRPVSIRPPQSPQLKRFTFFMTTGDERDGGEGVYLHMGYFQTLSEAQSLLPVVRRRFPDAIAAPAPADLPDESLTDTQVMRILERRGAPAARSEAEGASAEQIALLRPEDTVTRRALKQAVVEGTPVFFAVQLDWSAQPIDSSRIPPLAIFKTHTLYSMESRREGRCSYFLRLGFFEDAASAKEAAFWVRSKFASAVVVAVTEQEHTCAHEASTDGLGLAHVCLPIYEAADDSGTLPPAPAPKRLIERPRRSSREPETLEQTLQTLAARELWNDPDSLSDTGVRHLKVEVERMRRRSGGS